MLRILSRPTSQITRSLRCYSIQFPIPPTPEQKDIKPNTAETPDIANTTAKDATSTTQPPKLSARERAKFTSMSFRDIFDGFLTTEETFDPIDTAPIFANPREFVALSTFHREQVIQELEKRMKRNWGLLTDDQKRTAYFISYGNWGPRENLSDNVYGNVSPEDLPFSIPSQVKNFHPEPSTPINLLKPVDLMQVSEGRREEFKNMTRRLDPMTKTIVYLAAIISLLALWRDKLYGEEAQKGPIEVPESPLVLAELKRQEEQEAKEREEKERLEKEEQQRLEQELASKAKKWYYLWLK